jgi:hypothetical protein
VKPWSAWVRAAQFLLAAPLAAFLASGSTAMTSRDASPILLQTERHAGYVELTLEGRPGHGERYVYTVEVTGKSRSRNSASYVAGAKPHILGRTRFPDEVPWRVTFTIADGAGRILHKETVAG